MKGKAQKNNAKHENEQGQKRPYKKIALPSAQRRKNDRQSP
jgi:hypothetical protein